MPNEATNTNTSTDTNTTAANDLPANFDEWIGKQPDNVKALYTQHVTGLQNTVKATREERDTLRTQLKDLLPKAEKGSELEKSLTESLSKLELAERRAAFVEDAVKPEIGCRNPKAAFLLAQADNLFDRRGSPDWAAIKAAAPELFGAPRVDANAGDGTDNQPPKADMNNYIRRMAGRN